MKSWRKVVLFGFLVWLIPFVIAMFIFFIHDSNRALFESIMAVAVTCSAIILGLKYMKTIQSDFLKVGAVLGVVWFLICILIDTPMMLLGGPMLMTFGEYMSDIGVTYLIIPVVTIGIGMAQSRGYEKKMI